MAMDTYLPSIPQTHFKNVHNPHHMLECCRSHIFPALVEALNAMLIEVLRDVAEADGRDDPVSAIRVLAINNFTSPGY